jgi:hypothetical protein
MQSLLPRVIAACRARFTIAGVKASKSSGASPGRGDVPFHPGLVIRCTSMFSEVHLQPNSSKHDTDIGSTDGEYHVGSRPVNNTIFIWIITGNESLFVFPDSSNDRWRRGDKNDQHERQKKHCAELSARDDIVHLRAVVEEWLLAQTSCQSSYFCQVITPCSTSAVLHDQT